MQGLEGSLSRRTAPISFSIPPQSTVATLGPGPSPSPEITTTDWMTKTVVSWQTPPPTTVFVQESSSGVPSIISSTFADQTNPTFYPPPPPPPLPHQHGQGDSNNNNDNNNNNNNQQKQNHKALSDGSEDVLIAFGSIGGTLLFLFLIYAFYKTRRGVPFNEILNFKAGRRGKKLREPPLLKSSDSMPRPDEDRAWNPASTFATATAEKVGIKKDPQKPKMVMIRANSNKSTGSSSSQESDLEKPAVSAFAERSFLKDIDAASSGKRSSTVNWPLHPTTRNSRASSPLIPSIGSLSQSDTRNTRDRTITSTNGSVDRFPNPEAYLAAPFEPPPRLLGGVDTSRFSWSENASHPEPPTPRFALERQSVATSARSSLPRFRKIDSWVSNQTGRLNSTLLRNQPGDVISTLDENEPQQQGGEGGAKARSGPKVWKSVLKGDDELEDVDERETLVEMPGPLARDGAARVGAGPPGGEGHARQVSDATVFRQHPGARMSTPKARRMKSEDLDAKLRMPGAM